MPIYRADQFIIAERKAFQAGAEAVWDHAQALALGSVSNELVQPLPEPANPGSLRGRDAQDMAVHTMREAQKLK